MEGPPVVSPPFPNNDFFGSKNLPIDPLFLRLTQMTKDLDKSKPEPKWTSWFTALKTNSQLNSDLEATPFSNDGNFPVRFSFSEITKLQLSKLPSDVANNLTQYFFGLLEAIN